MALSGTRVGTSDKLSAGGVVKGTSVATKVEVSMLFSPGGCSVGLPSVAGAFETVHGGFSERS
ncbi:MAG: hypothetical protein EOO41_00030 [Methanobacteriota archaeon]|nr:MAG: hypothetical protein EOO41_00030 [Euryarchaeota archaeon]